jgi:hypothetical protein
MNFSQRLLVEIWIRKRFLLVHSGINLHVESLTAVSLDSLGSLHRRLSPNQHHQFEI